MDIHDSLKVKVLEAKKLVSVDGMAPTTFVEIVVGDSKRSTRDVSESNNPRYGDTPLIFERILSTGTQAILAYIFFRDPSGGKNTCIGVVVIPLETFYQSPKVPIDYWYEVQPPPTSEEEQDDLIRSARAENSGALNNRKSSTFNFDGIEESRLRLEIEYDNDVDEGVPIPFEENLVPPNLVQVTIIRIEGLPVSAEVFVEAQIASLRKATKSQRKSNAPVFNEQLDIPVTDGSEFLELAVKQFSIIRSTVIGRARIPLNEIAAAGEKGHVRTLTLLGESYNFTEKSLGEISIVATWVYDAATEEQLKSQGRTSSSVFKTITKLFGKKKTKATDEEDDDENYSSAPVLTQAKRKEEQLRKLGLSADMSAIELSMYLEKQKEDRLQEIQRLMEEEDYKVKEREEMDMPEGDYTVQVHIIEVADLVGLNSSGLSDPIIFVELMGQRQCTRPIYEVNSAFFDQTFFFNFKDLKREQLFEAHVKISVYDYNFFRSNELIGVYQADLPSIYASRDHELYRRWAILRDPTNEDDIGSQGLLKYSIVVLAAGDTQRIHDPITEEDDEEEKDADVKEGAGVADMDRNFSQTLHFLVISLFRADGLPGYDRILSTIKQGLYVYVKVEFAGCKPLKTTKVAVSGKKNLSVIFDEELWLPIWVPSYSKRASITLMNREFGRKDQVIATSYIDFDSVPKYDRDPVVDDSMFMLGSLGLANKKYDGAPLQWLHFYGANPTVRGGPKAAQFMNKFPNYGSSYRGSLLASFRVLKNPHPGGLLTKQLEAAHKKSISYDIPESKMPQMGLYNLKVMIYQGSDFGSRGQGNHTANSTTSSVTSSSSKYKVVISIGSHEIHSQMRVYENGSVDWIELHDLKDIDLPRDLKYLPDTFITVYKGNELYHQSISFTRLKSLDLLPNAKDVGDKPARWYELKHDLSHRSTPTATYPGNVLMKICLANIEDEVANADWETYRRRLEITKPYHLRVYVYQCKSLPSVNENGLIDPYVKVRFGGEKAKTIALSGTRNPAYYEVFTFEKMLPEELELAPHIVIQLWDNGSRNIPVAAVRKELKDLPIVKNVFDPSTPKPFWMDFAGIDGAKQMGKILVAFQLFEKKDMKQALPPPPPIKPTFRRCYLDIHTIGIRNFLVQNKGKTIVRRPSVKYEVFEEGTSRMQIVCGSPATSNPANPNYLSRNILAVNLPDDPMFAPTLEVFIYDERTLSKQLVAVCDIDLSKKLIWNAEEYVPPRHHQYLEDTVLARKKVEEKLKRRVTTTAKRVKKGKDTGLAVTFVGQDEENVLDQVELPPDDGKGVFPAKSLTIREGMVDHDLPEIRDKEEEENYLKDRSQKDRSIMDDATLQRLGLSIDPNLKKPMYSVNEQIKRILKIPTAWTSANFMKGREEWVNSKHENEGGDLEYWMQFRPFENYDLMRGHVAFNKLNRRKDTTRKVGILKAVIRVTLNNPRADREYNEFKEKLRRIETCKIRCYVIRANNLQPVDGGWLWSHDPDPYLQISLEGNKDVKTIVDRKGSPSTNPEFYHFSELDAKLPGAGILKIGVYDKSFMMGEQLLGETVIDLEDRWFHPKWSAAELKPIENRNLYKPTSRSAQGTLMMWVDIFTVQDALKYPPVEFKGPEKRKFEIRIVCWRSQNVYFKGYRSLDLFAMFFLDGAYDTRQSTDTHWMCRTGAGSWNYRVKIPIELPISNREAGRLRVQLWNRNIIRSNELIGETTIPLFNWLLLVYKRQNAPVFPFKEKKDAKAKLEKKKATGWGDEDEDEEDDDDNQEEMEEHGIEMVGADLEDADPSKPQVTPVLETSDLPPDMRSTHISELQKTTTAVNDLNDEHLDSEPLLRSEKRNNSSIMAKPLPDTKKSGKKTSSKLVEADALNDLEDKKAKEEEQASVMASIQQFFGYGDAIADDAEWLQMTYLDRRSNKSLDRGKLAVSISIVPESEAVSRPVGTGRDEPNNNPYLPPPVGRFSFSFNPLNMFFPLLWLLFSNCDAFTMFVLCCLCCCVCFIGVFAFVSVYLSGIESLISLFKGV